MDLSTTMRQQWNRRAQTDAMHHALNRYGIGEWNPTEFYRTGDQNLKQYLDPFCAANGIRVARRTCLEIGCGPGRLTRGLATRFGTVIALDVSDEMLRVAQANIDAPNVTFMQGNGIDLVTIAPGSVSFVFSMVVLQHIPDVQVQYTYLREIGRVLKRSGWYFIHLYADAAGYAVKEQRWRDRAESGDLKGWSDAALPELQDNAYKTSMCTAVDDATTRAVLAQAGLSIVQDTGANTSAWVLGGQKT